MNSEPLPEREILRQALTPGGDCPSVQRLEKCLEAAPPPDLSRHLESCAHCRAELELLRTFYAPPRPEEAEAVRQVAGRLQTPREHMGTPLRPHRSLLQFRWLSGAVMAAAALLLVTALGLQLRHRSAPRLAATNSPEDNVFRSGRLAVVAPAGDLSSAPEQIQWQSVAGAAQYRVRLLEVDHAPLWTDSTSQVQLAIPAAVRAEIVPSKPLFVEVTAFDSAGHKLAESELVRFRVLRKVDNR